MASLEANGCRHGSGNSGASGTVGQQRARYQAGPFGGGHALHDLFGDGLDHNYGDVIRGHPSLMFENG
jgi:hypothetical protein